MAIVYLALGTNLGDRAGNCRRALDALRHSFSVEVVSPCYETEPAYVLDQPRFYNLVCRATTTLTPLEVLRALKQIESDLGRLVTVRYGPRLIDLDLLFYDDLILDLPDLTVPHPLLQERAFVLIPLADIAPELLHPKLGLTISALRDKLESELSTVRQLGSVNGLNG
ncbi:MAG: 2-amino-4-hydroxy-6-hydroxymethyldihydropteridine diphosphokinase [Chloroflexota bacterium]